MNFSVLTEVLVLLLVRVDLFERLSKVERLLIRTVDHDLLVVLIDDAIGAARLVRRLVVVYQTALRL